MARTFEGAIIRRWQEPERVIVPEFDYEEEDGDEDISMYRTQVAQNEDTGNITYDDGIKEETAVGDVRFDADVMAVAEARKSFEDNIDALSVSTPGHSPPKPRISATLDDGSLEEHLFHLTEQVAAEELEPANPEAQQDEAAVSVASPPILIAEGDTPPGARVRPPKHEVRYRSPISAERSPRLGPRTKVRPRLPMEVTNARAEQAEKWFTIQDAASDPASRMKCEEIRMSSVVRSNPNATDSGAFVVITKVSTSPTTNEKSLQQFRLPLDELKVGPARHHNQVVLYWRGKYITMMEEKVWVQLKHDAVVGGVRESRRTGDFPSAGEPDVPQHPHMSWDETVDAAFSVALSKTDTGEEDGGGRNLVKPQKTFPPSQSRKLPRASPRTLSGAFPVRRWKHGAPHEHPSPEAGEKPRTARTPSVDIQVAAYVEKATDAAAAEHRFFEPPPFVEPPPPRGTTPTVKNMQFLYAIGGGGFEQAQAVVTASVTEGDAPAVTTAVAAVAAQATATVPAPAPTIDADLVSQLSDL